MEKQGDLKIRIKVYDKEIEISYPITVRTGISMEKNATLPCVIETVKELLTELKKDELQ